MGGRISARSPIKFKLVWRRMNARRVEYKWTIEVCKTKVRGKPRHAPEFLPPCRRQKRAMPPVSLRESGKFALFRLYNRANVPGRGPKCYRAAALHPGGIPVATFSFGCASCGSLGPGVGASPTHASRRPPGVAFGYAKSRCRARATESGGTKAALGGDDCWA